MDAHANAHGVPMSINLSQHHHAIWPTRLPRELVLPDTSLWFNTEVSARRYPRKPAYIFLGRPLTYGELHEQALALAGWLQAKGVARGDRVIVFMQNCPQFAIAVQAILRADAVVVPVNPMNLTQELAHYVRDSGATLAFAAQELLPRLQPLLGQGLQQIVVATYSDYLRGPSAMAVPEFVAAPRAPLNDPRLMPWADALAAQLAPRAIEGGPDDLAVMPYTSGTTGHPKGCMHTHRSVMFNAAGVWSTANQGSVGLAVLPMFHVTGMQTHLHGALYNAATVVLLPR